MTSAKARYERQIGEFVDDIRFDEAQLAMLRSIKDDDTFVESVRNIATLYGCLRRSEPEKLSAGEFRATLDDLKRNAATLEEKLENIPQGVDVALWRFSYRMDSPGKMEKLKDLLSCFVDEIENALDEEPGASRPGRKLAYANWYAADSLIQRFESFGLSAAVNRAEDSKISPATLCLKLIFSCNGLNLSRSAVEEYLRPQGKITRKIG